MLASSRFRSRASPVDAVSFRRVLHPEPSRALLPRATRTPSGALRETRSRSPGNRRWPRRRSLERWTTPGGAPAAAYLERALTTTGGTVGRADCGSARAGGRDPEGRRHAATAPPAADDADALVELFSRLSDRSHYCASTAPAASTRARRDVPRPGLGRARRARRQARAADGSARSSRSRATRACATPRPPRSHSPSPTGAGPRDRHAPARAARAPRGRGRDHALRRRGADREHRHARRLLGRRLRGRAPRRGRRGRAELPDRPTESLRTRVAERDHVAVTASLRPFFRPRSVAVIGASAREGSIGGDSSGTSAPAASKAPPIP